MRRILTVAALAALLCSCESHFITDNNYRHLIEQELAERKELFTEGDLWSVFDEQMTTVEREATEFMYASMSIADMADKSGDYYLGNVRKSFVAKDQMSWGKKIPADLFRHFVLPVRVNNENLDDFRTEMYAELSERVKGLSLYDAALEVNHWCHEKVTYEPSDSRTSSPLATIRTAKGRCGEESVLAVAALRTVGIPARQVYTPRWAHTDDNHAWVEVWVDGKWWFMGACEPAPVLNYAWFNAPAARAMLMHTRVFGQYEGGNDIMSRTKCFTEINVIDTYCPTQRLDVKVVDEDQNPVEGATVEWKIYNYAELYTVATKTTDRRGTAALTTGCGDLVVWASKGDRFGLAMLDDKDVTVVLDHSRGDRFDMDFDIIPPKEGIIEVDVTESQTAENERRLAQENAIRDAYTATFPTTEKLEWASDQEREVLIGARGNAAAIEEFLKNAGDERYEEALMMLGSLSAKDLRDTPAEVLEECLHQTIPTTDNPLYIDYILSPRIAGELIEPFKEAIREVLDPIVGNDHIEPAQLIDWTVKNIKAADLYNPLRLQMTPAGVLRVRAADSRSRDIFFVALCRTYDIAARIDQVTGKTQYYLDGWKDVDFDKQTVAAAAQGRLAASYTPTALLPDPLYYRHFTIARIDEGLKADLLNFEEGDATELGASASWKNLLSKPTNFDAGYYMLTSGSRMASGRVLAHVEFFDVVQGETTELQLMMPQTDDDVEVIGFVDAEQLYLPDGGDEECSLLSTTGRGYFVLAVMGANDEPSSHALRGMAALSDCLNEWGRKVVVLNTSTEKTKMFDRKLFEPIEGVVCYGVDNDQKVLKMVTEACSSKSSTLPVVVIADSFGRVVYFSQGYNTSIEGQMRRVIDNLTN